MKLTDLDPQFERVGEQEFLINGERCLRETRADVETLAEADGITFLCPHCILKNGGEVGTHSIHITFAGRGVPDHLGSSDGTKPSRWQASGTGYNDLTLTPSIDLTRNRPDEWHGFITNGEVR